MRSRVLLGFVAVLLAQATGCCDRCRCCGNRDSRQPPRDVWRNEGPPPAILPPGPNAPPVPGPPKPTGAYGGN